MIIICIRINEVQPTNYTLKELIIYFIYLFINFSFIIIIIRRVIRIRITPSFVVGGR
jgi:hypothetical protein